MIRNLICLFGMLAASFSFADFVKITNNAGAEIEVELLSLRNEKVEFKMRNGKVFTYELMDLSPDSRKLIKEWEENSSKTLLTQDHRLTVSVHTGRSSKDTDKGYSGWKNMDEKIEPGVLVKNEEPWDSFKDLKATLVLVAEDVTDKDNLKVVYKDQFTFSINFKDSYEWEGKPFKLDYLIDDNDGWDNSYGFRYRYYFLVIRNPDGSVGYSAASRSSWAEKPDLIKKLKLNTIYDRSLRETAL